MPVSFKFGDQPVEVLLSSLAKDLRVTAGDCLYALNRQKTRILQRTARGVDVHGNPFAPYSTNGPFYWYPGKSAANRQAAAKRAAKKVGGQATRVGVKFKSYADFKRSLGRSTVDLLGARAPHMLQAIVVKVGGLLLGSDRVSGLIASGGIRGLSAEAPVTTAAIGIYGPEAERAEGHNSGSGRLPKREFFGASEEDARLIAEDIGANLRARLRRYLQ